MSAGSKLSQSGQSQEAAEVLAGNTSAEPFTDLFAALYVKAGAETLHISQDDFAAWLREIGRKYLPPDAPHGAAGDFYNSIHVRELALAQACARGDEAAWTQFLTEYREKLYGMARHIAKEDATAHELADSVYADLFGTNLRQGKRVSKLASYTGRGSLEGWLRTVLAQQYIDHYRKQRRLVSLDAEIEQGTQFAATVSPAVQTDPRFTAAVDAALRSLTGEHKFMLAAYYLDGRTLAEIARILHVHESSVSRRLNKIIENLQKKIRAELLRRGVDRRRAEELMQADVTDLQVNVRAHLAQDSSSASFSKQESPARAGEGSE